MIGATREGFTAEGPHLGHLFMAKWLVMGPLHLLPVSASGLKADLQVPAILRPMSGKPSRIIRHVII